MPLTSRLATLADEPALSALMTLAIDRLQDGFLTPAQVGRVTDSWGWTGG
jgi:hypothetical protein